MNVHIWWWPLFLKTKLSKYIFKNNLLFSNTCEFHEGLTITFESCKAIVDFLNTNNSIRNDLFNSNCCVEEFALQTLCLNFTGYYYQIGNFTMGDDTKNIKYLPKNRFVYKTIRED